MNEMVLTPNVTWRDSSVSIVSILLDVPADRGLQVLQGGIKHARRKVRIAMVKGRRLSATA